MARIDHHEFGRIVVDGREEANDLVEVLDELPAHLVVGTGADGRLRPDPSAIRQPQERGVTVETLPASQAVRRFGELDPAGAAAALHLTC